MRPSKRDSRIKVEGIRHEAQRRGALSIQVGRDDVQFNLYPKGPGKTSSSAQQTLPGRKPSKPYRALCKTAFAAIAETITATPAK